MFGPFGNTDDTVGLDGAVVEYGGMVDGGVVRLQVEGMEVYEQKHLVRASLNSAQQQQLERPPQPKGSHILRSDCFKEGEPTCKLHIYRFILCPEQFVQTHQPSLGTAISGENASQR